MAAAVSSAAQETRNTPKELGFTFPDEWEAHAGTMMIFPAREGYGRKTTALRKEFAAVGQAIAKNEAMMLHSVDLKSDPNYLICRETSFPTPAWNRGDDTFDPEGLTWTSHPWRPASCCIRRCLPNSP